SSRREESGPGSCCPPAPALAGRLWVPPLCSPVLGDGRGGARCCPRGRLRQGHAVFCYAPLFLPRNRWTSATTALGSQGLARYPSQPTSIAFSGSDARACAVSAMLGICSVEGSSFSTWVASH